LAKNWLYDERSGGEKNGMTRMLGGAILIFGFWLLSTMVIF
jgi:hypothetical protein